MNLKETKQYLNQLKYLNNIINSKLEQVSNLRRFLNKTSRDAFSEKVQTSGNEDKISETIAKIVDLENEINCNIDKLVELEADITRKIDLVEDAACRLLLTLRHLNFKTWEEIAEEMYCSKRTVFRIYRRALENLALNASLDM